MNASNYVEQINNWLTSYGIDFTKSIDHEEMSQEQYEQLQELDKSRLVWTEHSTCEQSQYTNGLHVFGDSSLLEQEASGCGCWQSQAYHIGNNPWQGSEDTSIFISTTAYLPCDVCNPLGDGDGEEGCEGPEIPEGADRSDCEGGMVNWYFD